ncbi:FAD-dependent oxidoreductase [Streptomyces sp. SID14478]|uniref:FAD-dependent monooxygenase n=1 Tax=Streptomyces sp. SID14478 TaxID=2706073 RepID=UPI0013DA10A9|nr:FAD-dependent monooxygenase [Streptomyces sp. SID14478]NEB79113.1 FAD-dependent oxidoreductase [Streptomyces sp. SID14478]
MPKESLRGTSVLISGASVAGPALAYWLSRYGAHVTVVEQAPELRTGGQIIDVRGVGREVARRMGLLEEMRAARTPTDGLRLVDDRNAAQAFIPVEGFHGDGPIAEIEIGRGSLSKVIYRATADDVEYLFGDRIAVLDDSDEGVRVQFDHAEPRTFDAVIGADGLHSATRKKLFGPERAFLRHLGSYIAWWTVPNDLQLHDVAHLYGEPGRSLVVRSAEGNTRALAAFTFNESPLDYDYRDTELTKNIVRSRIADMGWEASRIARHIDETPDFYFDSFSQVVLGSWSKGRVGLVGDAAYCASPLSGHGATISLVGAYVLAGELARCGGDVAAGLASYERVLRPWITTVQELGRNEGARMMTPATPFGVAARTRLVQLFGYLPSRMRPLLVRPQLRVSNGFRLPDYSDARLLPARH